MYHTGKRTRCCYMCKLLSRFVTRNSYYQFATKFLVERFDSWSKLIFEQLKIVMVILNCYRLHLSVVIQFERKNIFTSKVSQSRIWPMFQEPVNDLIVLYVQRLLSSKQSVLFLVRFPHLESND
jgi:hypothetical protein